MNGVSKWVSLLLTIGGAVVIIVRWTGSVDARLDHLADLVIWSDARSVKLEQIVTDRTDKVQKLVDDSVEERRQTRALRDEQRRTLSELRISVDSLAFRVGRLEEATRIHQH